MRRWALWGGGIGLALGLFDYVVLWSMGVVMQLNGRDVTFWVCLYFTISFAALCAALGAVLAARQQLGAQQIHIKEQADALLASRQQMAEQEKLATIGQLAACVAHEVRNPLGVIRTSASMLMEDIEPDDERFRAGEFICDEVIRLDAFCRALLQFARPLHISREPTDVGFFCAEVYEHVCLEHALSGVSISLEAGQQNASLSLDQVLLKQALVGLIHNAVQALSEMEQEDKRIALDWACTDESVLFSVRDNGEGASDEVKHRMFEPFVTTKSQGTGLGLSMATKIVEAHGGRLLYLEQKGLGASGKGACFQMAFPLDDNHRMAIES
jgi:signal transduction histidine kinase